MKKKMAILLGSLGAVVLVVIAVICWKNRYGAKLYTGNAGVNAWIRVEFLDANKVSGGMNFNLECLQDSDEPTQQYCYETEAPATRTFLIKDEATFNEIFYPHTLDVDFEKEMLVLHIFADIGSMDSYFLWNVFVDGDMVEISMKEKLRLFSNAKVGMYKFQRCVVVKMKKLDVNYAKFVD